MSGDYDYLNARVRGMSTALLTRDFFEHVLSSFTETILMDALLASAYGGDMREALSRHGSSQVSRAAEAAVRANAAAAFAKLLAIAPEGPRRLLALQLNRWDATNVLALLRARLAGAEPREAMSAVLPIGEMSEGQLAELAAEKDVESLADALTTWKHGIGFRLRRAILECESRNDPRSLERAVTAAYFSWALAQLNEEDREQALVRGCVLMHADLANVILLLRQARERARSRARPGPAAGTVLPPLPRGTLPQRILQELATADSLEHAFEILMATYLAPGIQRGILAYGQAQSLAVMEHFLEEVVVERGCGLFRRDMLGMAVPLGFLWRKYREMRNLRVLCRGAAYRMSPNAMRQELILA